MWLISIVKKKMKDEGFFGKVRIYGFRWGRDGKEGWGRQLVHMYTDVVNAYAEMKKREGNNPSELLFQRFAHPNTHCFSTGVCGMSKTKAARLCV